MLSEQAGSTLLKPGKPAQFLTCCHGRRKVTDKVKSIASHKACSPGVAMSELYDGGCPCSSPRQEG